MHTDRSPALYCDNPQCGSRVKKEPVAYNQKNGEIYHNRECALIPYEDFLVHSKQKKLVGPYTIFAEARMFVRLPNVRLSLRTFSHDSHAIIYIGSADVAEQYVERLGQEGQRRIYVGLDTAKDLPDWGRVLYVSDDIDGGLVGVTSSTMEVGCLGLALGRSVSKRI